jgi:IS605 OrfB family transposase
VLDGEIDQLGHEVTVFLDSSVPRDLGSRVELLIQIVELLGSVVEFAVEHEPSVLVLEDLTHYRETADDPIHDWPFADLQEKICYKATAEGIPVETVDPKDTSITCRKCGQATPEFRDGTEFSCRRCGYEVHADVNAAINIAKRYAE